VEQITRSDPYPFPVSDEENPGTAPEIPAYMGVVALDGPSGTGKSTVARRLADHLGARYLDTGAMYRAATVAALRRGADLQDPVAITAAVESATIVISTDPDAVSVTLDGEPVDDAIRSAETTRAVSAVSAVPAVRALLVDAQRNLISESISERGIVVEGRDIGSVVWPTAEPKVYLTASAEARARRRAGETGGAVATVAADIERRDRLDSTRAASPLTQVDDAVELDTTDLDIDQVVARLVELSRGAG